MPNQVATPAPFRIGYCLSLTGPLTANRQSAQLAHEIWREDINSRGGLGDYALIAYTQRATFRTVVGEVKFGDRGEWSQPRVVQVQFQNIASNEIGEFKDPAKQAAVSPNEFASGDLVYPYARTNPGPGT